MNVITDYVRNTAQDLLDFIDAGPSPWHVAALIDSNLAASINAWSVSLPFMSAR